LELRTGAPAPASRPKSMAVSAVATTRPLLVRSMIQSHDGGLLQRYDNGLAGISASGDKRGRRTNMLTATSEKVRVHPASPVVFVTVRRRSLKGINVAANIDRCRFATMQGAVLM
jgi:hypothetical protein